MITLKFSNDSEKARVLKSISGIIHSVSERRGEILIDECNIDDMDMFAMTALSFEN